MCSTKMVKYLSLFFLVELIALPLSPRRFKKNKIIRSIIKNKKYIYSRFIEFIYFIYNNNNPK